METGFPYFEHSLEAERLLPKEVELALGKVWAHAQDVNISTCMSRMPSSSNVDERGQ